MSTSYHAINLGIPDNFRSNTKYSDFAKTTSDFFNKEFPSGCVKLEAKTASKGTPLVSSLSRGLNGDTFTDELCITAVKDLATGAIQAQVKNTTNLALVKDTLTAKAVTTVSSANTLTETITLKNPAFENVKLELSGTLTPTGPGNAFVTAELNQGPLALTSSFDLFKGPVIKADAATRFRDFLVGAEANFDVASGKLGDYTASIAFDRPREKVVLQMLTGCNSFNASYYQRFADNMEVAYKSFWSQKAMAMEVGAKYYLLGGGFVKAKMDNAGRLGLSVASDLRPGMQVLLGASVDTNKLSEGGHRFGVELTYSA